MNQYGTCYNTYTGVGWATEMAREKRVPWVKRIKENEQ
jgi:hypothetical protein